MKALSHKSVLLILNVSIVSQPVLSFLNLVFLFREKVLLLNLVLFF